jgi:hypothetical protein
MRKTSGARLWAAAILLAGLVAWPQGLHAQATNARVGACGIVTLPGGAPVFFNDGATPFSVIDLRTKAPTASVMDYGLCLPLPGPSCGHPDLGEAFQVWLFARLASPDPAKNKEATDYLAGIQRSDFGQMGTDTAPDCKDKTEGAAGRSGGVLYRRGAAGRRRRCGDWVCACTDQIQESDTRSHVQSRSFADRSSAGARQYRNAYVRSRSGQVVPGNLSGGLRDNGRDGLPVLRRLVSIGISGRKG